MVPPARADGGTALHPRAGLPRGPALDRAARGLPAPRALPHALRGARGGRVALRSRPLARRRADRVGGDRAAAPGADAGAAGPARRSPRPARGDDYDRAAGGEGGRGSGGGRSFLAGPPRRRDPHRRSRRREADRPGAARGAVSGTYPPPDSRSGARAGPGRGFMRSSSAITWAPSSRMSAATSSVISTTTVVANDP